MGRRLKMEMTALRVFAALLALLLLGVACGKREWPSPRASEDKFRWRTAQVLRQKGCVIVSIEATGAWQNIASVNLLLEPIGTGAGDGCAGCPFVPRTTLSFEAGNPGYRKDMNRIVLTACDLDPAKTYRVQVVGHSIFPTLPTVPSDLMISDPQ